MTDRACPDDGVCHHDCPLDACFRVAFAAPFTDAYKGDDWPDRVKATLGTWGDWEEGTEGAPEVSTGEVKAFERYASNAGIIEAAARLGYLHIYRLTLDASWGEGTFWKAFRPERLVVLDRVLHKIACHPTGVQGDFTELPFRDRAFWATVLDGPYKLNGTPDEAVDARYGVEVPATWQDRMALIRYGIESAARVTEKFLLVKCQDQVSSGKVRWQTRDFADHAEAQGFRLRDELFIEGGRPQPEGRRQVHARRNYSTLLVLQRDA